MRLKILAIAIVVTVLWVIALIKAIGPSEAQSSDAQPPTLVSQAAMPNLATTGNQDVTQAILAACRRRQQSELIEVKTSSSGYTPRQLSIAIHPSNYGDRFVTDVYGRPVQNQPLIVLHETVASASSAVNFFRTPHPREDDQASYHTLITLDGTVVYLVPPEKRAFGAGNSSFNGEAVRTKPNLPPSVNNFAYHISLETPRDGNHNGNRHSGYTEAQYRSLAWLISRTGVPESRITTHQFVDRSGSRKDPRSFNQSKLLKLVSTYPQADAVGLDCVMQVSALYTADHDMSHTMIVKERAIASPTATQE